MYEEYFEKLKEGLHKWMGLYYRKVLARLERESESDTIQYPSIFQAKGSETVFIGGNTVLLDV